MTPYYQDDAVTIYHGDCREIVPSLGRFDLLLTDPPYGEVNREDSGLRSLDKGVADVSEMQPSELLSLCVPHVLGTAYIWCGINQVSNMRMALTLHGFSTRLCVWEKSNPSPMNGQHLWLSSIECCVYGKLPGAFFSGFCESPVWLGLSEKGVHPTQKPEWLFELLVEYSCPPNGTILDPFAGSGTTGRAAKDLGRKCTLIEKEERYCEIAAKRMGQEVLAL